MHQLFGIALQFGLGVDAVAAFNDHAADVGRQLGKVGVCGTVDGQHFGQVMVPIYVDSPLAVVCPSASQNILQNIEDFYTVIRTGCPAVSLRVFLYAKILHRGSGTAFDQRKTRVDHRII